LKPGDSGFISFEATRFKTSFKLIMLYSAPSRMKEFSIEKEATTKLERLKVPLAITNKTIILLRLKMNTLH
jgi:hypothetical protein